MKYEGDAFLAVVQATFTISTRDRRQGTGDKGQEVIRVPSPLSPVQICQDALSGTVNHALFFILHTSYFILHTFRSI